MHEIKHSAYAMLATVPSGEAIALTKPCRCSYKLNRAENLTGIVANNKIAICVFIVAIDS
jgi:hypothetical protein